MVTKAEYVELQEDLDKTLSELRLLRSQLASMLNHNIDLSNLLSHYEKTINVLSGRLLEVRKV